MAANNNIPRLMSLRRWAQREGFGYTLARIWATRADDPLPVLRLGRRLSRIDANEARAWLKRQDQRFRNSARERTGPPIVASADEPQGRR